MAEHPYIFSKRGEHPPGPQADPTQIIARKREGGHTNHFRKTAGYRNQAPLPHHFLIPQPPTSTCQECKTLFSGHNRTCLHLAPCLVQDGWRAQLPSNRRAVRKSDPQVWTRGPCVSSTFLSSLSKHHAIPQPPLGRIFVSHLQKLVYQAVSWAHEALLSCLQQPLYTSHSAWAVSICRNLVPGPTFGSAQLILKTMTFLGTCIVVISFEVLKNKTGHR